MSPTIKTPSAEHEAPSRPATSVPPRATGRQLVMFNRDVPAARIAKLLRSTDIPLVRSSSERSMRAAFKTAENRHSATLLESFGVAAIGGRPEEARAVATSLAAMDEVADTRPEFWMFAVAGPPWEDSAGQTWGVDAVRASQSSFTGAGVRVAVLDTGLDLKHPDWAARTVVSRSFVPGEDVDDVQGHGTHCAGTAVGLGASSGNVPRYGVAPEAELYVGKVLNNGGAGRELDIIAGMEWAIGQGCQVVSMSLGRAVAEDEQYDPIYEEIGLRALEAGTLIVAAAGNESDRRYGYVAPVGSPANAPSIMAVAAIGADGGIGGFSCGGTGVGKVDVAAPGVQIFSSVPRPRMYAKVSGTSMACPHVAGIAALLAQSDSTLRGRALWDAVVASAQPIGKLPKRDVGSGLVSAP